jgi:hypothetical protein
LYQGPTSKPAQKLAALKGHSFSCVVKAVIAVRLQPLRDGSFSSRDSLRNLFSRAEPSSAQHLACPGSLPTHPIPHRVQEALRRMSRRAAPPLLPQAGPRAFVSGPDFKACAKTPRLEGAQLQLCRKACNSSPASAAEGRFFPTVRFSRKQSTLAESADEQRLPCPRVLQARPTPPIESETPSGPRFCVRARLSVVPNEPARSAFLAAAGRTPRLCIRARLQSVRKNSPP